MTLVKQKVIEGRGVRDVVYAILTKDDSTGIEWGEVKHLVPVATLNKETESSAESHYYDDVPAINVNSEGADTVTITGALIAQEVLAEILGKSYDPTTGAFSDSEAVPPYVAIGYKSSNTDGSEYYAWRYKGTFSIPAENNNTKTNDTTGTGTELTYTGVFTEHEFTKAITVKGGSGSVTYKAGKAKGLKVDLAKGLADVTTFFDEVTTCDTLAAKG